MDIIRDFFKYQVNGAWVWNPQSTGWPLLGWMIVFVVYIVEDILHWPGGREFAEGAALILTGGGVGTFIHSKCNNGN